MGMNKDLLENEINLKISESQYKEIRGSLGDHEIKNIEPKDYDYSYDEVWRQLKSESTKAYKKLKTREYDLRHNLK